MKGFDSFSGCGGFSCAAANAGIEVIGAANHWELAVKVHAANHPTTAHYWQDLRQFDFSLLDPFDFLFAGPACQGHSQAGQVGRKTDSTVRRTHDALRASAWAVVDCLEVCRPRFVIVENVPKFQKWPLLEQWLGCFRALGYRVTLQVLTASRWGVPQRRERLFVIGHHEGGEIAVSDPDVPEPGVQGIFDESIGGWVDIASMRKTVSKQGYKTAREKVELAHERSGGQLAWGQHSNYNAWGMPVDRPAPTVTTVPSFLWWTRGGKYRLWSRGELAAAQTLPTSYDFLGANKKDSSRLIGNAVPVKLAEGVIREVLRSAL